MISTGDVKKGVIIELDGQLMKVLDWTHIKMARGSAQVNTPGSRSRASLFSVTCRDQRCRSSVGDCVSWGSPCGLAGVGVMFSSGRCGASGAPGDTSRMPVGIAKSGPQSGGIPGVKHPFQDRRAGRDVEIPCSRRVDARVPVPLCTHMFGRERRTSV